MKKTSICVLTLRHPSDSDIPFHGLDMDCEILQDMDDKMVHRNRYSSERSVN